MSTQPLNFGASVAPTPFPGGFGENPGGGGGGVGSNQWMSGWPVLPFAGQSQGQGGTTNTPGVVPPAPSAAASGPNQFTGPSNAPGMTGIGKGLFAENPIDPALTSGFFNFLQSMIGKGASPFDLSSFLPSSGDATQPGQLTAPMTQLLQQMQALFAPGGSLGDLASKGVSALPVWQPMVDAMQRQIQQGQTNLNEQFNVGGGLVGSPYGQASADYQMQSNKDLNSLLGQLQFQGIQDQLQAAGMEGSLGQMFQGMDQSAIDRTLQEFIRTRPEYSPLLPFMMGGATTFAPIVDPKHGAGASGGLLSSLGSLFGIGDSLGLGNIFKNL